jgi:hypothetical protein
MVHFLRQGSGGIPTSFSESHTSGRDQKQRAARVRFTPAPMPLAPAERRRSAARDLGFSTPTDFIASPLHRLVLPYPELDRSELQISLFA